jgi:hypothetical protein
VPADGVNPSEVDGLLGRDDADLAVECLQQERVVAAVLSHVLPASERQHDDSGPADAEHGVMSELARLDRCRRKYVFDVGYSVVLDEGDFVVAHGPIVADVGGATTTMSSAVAISVATTADWPAPTVSDSSRRIQRPAHFRCVARLLAAETLLA